MSRAGDPWGDLSATHLPGIVQTPRNWYAPEHGTPPEPADGRYDDLDVARYAAALKRLFDQASRACDVRTLTADARQFAAGCKQGLADALRLLDVSRKPPVTEPAAQAEEPHA